MPTYFTLPVVLCFVLSCTLCCRSRSRHAHALEQLSTIKSHQSSAQHTHQGTAESVLGQRQDVFTRIELDYAGLHPHENDRSLQQSTDSSSVYQPIRFQFDTQAIESRRGQGLDEEIDYILSTVLPAVAGNWSRHLYVVPNTLPIFVNASTCVGIFQGAQLGDFEATTLYDADIAIAVAAYDELSFDDGSYLPICLGESSTLAIALPCALDQVDRPVVGFINFCLNKAQTASTGTLTDALQQEFGTWFNTSFRDRQVTNNVIDVATHEIGHVLGMTADLYKYYRDENGTPRTPRPFQETTVTCPNNETVTQIFPSQETVQILPSTGGRLSYHMVTPRVAQVARNLFDCQSLQGARLDDSPADCLTSHWHERLYYGEIMGPLYSAAGQNLLSPLTLALMEDSGFYRVDYRGAPTPAYGLGAGCEFVYGECVVNGSIPVYGNNSFCATPIRFTILGQLAKESLNSATCDPSHQAWVTCDLYNSTFLPFSFNMTENTVDYWSAPELFTANDAADSCPVRSIGLGRDCTVNDPSYEPFYAGETTGRLSRCVSTQIQAENARYNRPACFEIVCDAIAAQVQLRADSQVFSCDWDGQVIPVEGDLPYNIVCPARAAVCPNLFSCPADCSGRGACMFNSSPPSCQCFDGWQGSPDCRTNVVQSASTMPTLQPALQTRSTAPRTMAPSLTITNAPSLAPRNSAGGSSSSTSVGSSPTNAISVLILSSIAFIFN